MDRSGLATAACSRDPAPGTPAAAAEGERLMRKMSVNQPGAAGNVGGVDPGLN